MWRTSPCVKKERKWRKKTCHLKHPILEKVLLLTFSSYIFYSLIFVCYFVCATCLFSRELVTVDPGTQYPGTTVELVTSCYTYNTNRCSLTYICLRDPSILIIWKSSFPIVGVSGVLLFYSISNRYSCYQTVKTLIRRRVLRRLIWVYTVCLCPQKWDTRLIWVK